MPTTTAPGTVHTATTDDQPTPTPTSPPASVRPRTTTTDEPDTTSTTGEAVMTWEEREESAEAVVLSVGYKIASGVLAGVDTYVASSAEAGLAQMINSLERPSGARVVSATETSAGFQVLLEMTDNVGSGQDGLTEVHRLFYFDTRTDKNGALITAIYAAPRR